MDGCLGPMAAPYTGIVSLGLPVVTNLSIEDWSGPLIFALLIFWICLLQIRAYIDCGGGGGEGADGIVAFLPLPSSESLVERAMAGEEGCDCCVTITVGSASAGARAFGGR